MNVEFTDRYGGRAPAWIRGCHGQCKAMGFYPTKDRSQWPEGTRPPGAPEEDGTPDDGWRFVTCRKCNGTGHVSWFRSIARIPLWIWKGIRFARVALDAKVNPPEWTFRKRFACWLWCSFGSDLRAIIKRY